MITQFGRQATLFVQDGEELMDLSDLRFTFKIRADDRDSPNHAEIKIYNISAQTRARIRGEFVRVVVQAGYEGNLGIIFDGTLKQLGWGREPGSTDTYLVLYCADGDMAFTESWCSVSMPAGTTRRERLGVIADTMVPQGVTRQQIELEEFGGVLPRGKVLWGLSKARMAEECLSGYATWSIQQNQVVVLQKQGYLPGEAVVLTGQSGLIGRPEQTVEGIRAKCLINPRIRVATRVQLDNASLNRNMNVTQYGTPYDKWAASPQLFANVTTDGIYRVMVIDYEGDTRGGPWYCDLVLLAIDPATDQVIME